MGNVSSTLPSPPISIEAAVALLGDYKLHQVVRLGRFIKTVVIIKIATEELYLLHVYVPAEQATLLPPAIRSKNSANSNPNQTQEHRKGNPAHQANPDGDTAMLTMENNIASQLRQMDESLVLEGVIIPTTIHYGLVDGVRVWLRQRPYISNTIYTRLRKLPHLSRSELIWISFQLVQQTISLFAQGLWHGDLCPQTILLTEWHHVYIADFGYLVKPWLLDQDDSTNFLYYYDRDSEGVYLAPERFISNNLRSRQSSKTIVETLEAKQRADLFSLGCILYELWSIRQASEKPTPLVKNLDQVLKYKAAAISDSFANVVPAQIKELLNLLLQKDPLQRPDPANLAIILEQYFPVVFSSFVAPYSAILPLNQSMTDLERASEATLAKFASDIDDIILYFDPKERSIETLVVFARFIQVCLEQNKMRERHLLFGIELARRIGTFLLVNWNKSQDIDSRKERSVEKLAIVNIFIPSLVKLVDHRQVAIRVSSLHAMHQMIEALDEDDLERIEELIHGYVVPSIGTLTRSSVGLVRVQLAKLIPTIFSNQYANRSANEMPIWEQFEKIMLELISDSDSNVRQIILNNRLVPWDRLLVRYKVLRGKFHDMLTKSLFPSVRIAVIKALATVFYETENDWIDRLLIEALGDSQDIYVYLALLEGITNRIINYTRALNSTTTIYSNPDRFDELKGLIEPFTRHSLYRISWAAKILLHQIMGASIRDTNDAYKHDKSTDISAHISSLDRIKKAEDEWEMFGWHDPSFRVISVTRDLGALPRIMNLPPTQQEVHKHGYTIYHGTNPGTPWRPTKLSISIKNTGASCGAVSSDRMLVVTGHMDGLLRFWQVPTKTNQSIEWNCFFIYKIGEEAIRTIGFCKENTLIIVGTDSRVFLLEIIITETKGLPMNPSIFSGKGKFSGPKQLPLMVSKALAKWTCELTPATMQLLWAGEAYDSSTITVMLEDQIIACDSSNGKIMWQLDVPWSLGLATTCWTERTVASQGGYASCWLVFGTGKGMIGLVDLRVGLIVYCWRVSRLGKHAENKDDGTIEKFEASVVDMNVWAFPKSRKTFDINHEIDIDEQDGVCLRMAILLAGLPTAYMFDVELGREGRCVGVYSIGDAFEMIDIQSISLQLINGEELLHGINNGSSTEEVATIFDNMDTEDKCPNLKPHRRLRHRHEVEFTCICSDSSLYGIANYDRHDASCCEGINGRDGDGGPIAMIIGDSKGKVRWWTGFHPWLVPAYPSQVIGLAPMLPNKQKRVRMCTQEVLVASPSIDLYETERKETISTIVAACSIETESNVGEQSDKDGNNLHPLNKSKIGSNNDEKNDGQVDQEMAKSDEKSCSVGKESLEEGWIEKMILVLDGPFPPTSSFLFVITSKGTILIYS